jgi:bifunctional oligoribonuclease and PAP phosphatase NrnA
MAIISLVSEFNQILQQKKSIVVTCHTNPDGDAIGSSLALAWVLKKMGHDVNVVIPNMYPAFLAWMPGISDVIIFEHQSKIAKPLIQHADVIFCLDYNTLKRSGATADDLIASPAAKYLIDHHPNPDVDDFSLILSVTDKSSTAELIYFLLCETENLPLIDKVIAECLYVGIMTDTGSFSHAIKHSDTFRVTASLIDKGIDAERIHRLIYDTLTENKLRLLGHAITNRMLVMEEYRTAIITLTKADLKQFDYQIGDTEGIVNFPLSMAKINLAVLITEKKDHVRLSFRSKGVFSVNDFAREHFEGGGHHNAAGGNSSLSMKDTVNVLIKLLPSVIQDLDYQYDLL